MTKLNKAEEVLRKTYIADSAYLGKERATYQWDEGRAVVSRGAILRAMIEFAKLTTKEALEEESMHIYVNSDCEVSIDKKRIEGYVKRIK